MAHSMCKVLFVAAVLFSFVSVAGVQGNDSYCSGETCVVPERVWRERLNKAFSEGYRKGYSDRARVASRETGIECPPCSRSGSEGYDRLPLEEFILKITPGIQEGMPDFDRPGMPQPPSYDR